MSEPPELDAQWARSAPARAAGGSVEALERSDGACFAVRVPPA